ncbi:NUDIX hydrolase [Clostridium rectalis]|uniref:NUDIX hydrolase n=1 Tax=Clostridium rectalis TaxID=2040295 RepID=UPI000F63B473|nr:CoA pyrophosphatase [Clostridium rectalis]
MLDNIEKIFKERKVNFIGEYEKSAVMIFLLREKGELFIIFEVRALTLSHQPGDISLPGGRIEENESTLDCAIRECMEELNLDRSDIKVIGEMDYLVTPYNKIIYPFISKLKSIEIIPNKDEVNHIFKVPLEFFITNEPECYEVKLKQELPESFPYHLIIGGKDYNFSSGKLNQYFYQYKGYVIWGITAFIIKSFIGIIKGKI